MDRDNRWERTSKAYELLTDPRFAISKLSAAESINKSYQEGITDEFIEPVRLSSASLKDGDGVVFFNDTATTEIYTRSIVGSVRCV